MDEKERIEKRQELTTKTFWLGLKIIFIFAVPACAGAFLGLWLDGKYMTGRKITLAVLCLTFLFSWVITIVEYKKLVKSFKDLSK